MSDFHTSVMLAEVLDFLDIKKDHWYVDCNLGGGGHTQAILEKGGKVLGIDLDEESIWEVTNKLHQYIESGQLVLYQGNFSKLSEIISELEIKNIQGVLFDLGLSSHQLEKGDRGFSFNSEAPLDMRMDQKTQAATAADLINGLHEKELIELFNKFGEEKNSFKIAKRIVEVRKLEPIKTTKQLADLISSISPRGQKIHPATKVFQALRIAVNDELNNLNTVLPQALKVLNNNGRLVVISFHSLEDRIVKNTFKDWEDKGEIKILTDKPLEPSEEEVTDNPRSRSAKMRVCLKN